jgi:predicted nucleotidyltransferase
MRLSEHTRKLIRDTVQEVFGAEASVSLFGSRVNDESRGGDIDLLVKSQQPVVDRERKILQLIARLQLRLGDQPIDVLVLDPATKRNPVHEQALRTGELL